MKTFLVLVTGLILNTSAFGEVWEKPDYQADENHLPEESIEMQEEMPEEDKDRQHQETRPVGTNNEFQKIDDALSEDQESAQ